MNDDENGRNLDRRRLLAAALLGVPAIGIGAQSALAADAAPIVHSGVVATDLLEAKAMRLGEDVKSLVLLRYDDQTPFSPATYVRVAAEPDHPGKFEAADGTWWELSEDSVSPYTFGAKGGIVDDTSALQMAFDYLSVKKGGELYIPPMRFSFSKDLRLLAHHTLVRGAGTSSKLCGRDNARIIVGKADLKSDGRKAGFKTLHVTISNLHIAPDANHQGECLLLDFADNTTIADVIVGPWVLDGSTVTHGVKTNWVQYTQFRNVSINVNGYGIYILLPKSRTENEDHFSIYSSWLYCGKGRNKDVEPACIAIEREPGRSAAIFQLALYSCHLGSFMASKGDRYHTAGIRCISSESVDARILQMAQFVNCMFEYVGTGIDLKSATYGDTSRVVLQSCSFLQQNVCFLGQKTKSTVTSIANYFLQCQMIVDGPRVSFVGANVQTSVKEVSAQPLSYHSFSEKYSASSLSHICMAQKGQSPIKPKSDSLTITHTLDEEPGTFRIAPSWKTTWWIGKVDGQQFDVHFDPPPKKAAILYWDVEV